MRVLYRDQLFQLFARDREHFPIVGREQHHAGRVRVVDAQRLGGRREHAVDQLVERCLRIACERKLLASDAGGHVGRPGVTGLVEAAFEALQQPLVVLVVVRCKRRHERHACAVHVAFDRGQRLRSERKFRMDDTYTFGRCLHAQPARYRSEAQQGDRA